MKKFKNITVKEVLTLICDACGEQASQDDYTFHEFISINHCCGYGSIHGDGNQLSIDLCQQCFANMCGDSLQVTEPSHEEGDDKDELEYHNIFDAITQSKKEANYLKSDSDLRIATRDVLSANKITNQSELTAALKRVEQLWDAQYHSAEGNELHQLADLVSEYEGKSWDSYFNEIDAASDDFMVEREAIIKEKGAVSGTLSDDKANKGEDDDSRQSAIDEDNGD